MRKIAICFALGLYASNAWTAEFMSVGTGTAKFNGLLQMWALDDSTAGLDGNTNFRIRRAELKFSGSVLEKTRWFLMVDPAKSLSTGVVSNANDNKILQDFGMGFTLVEDLELVAGQFKVPTAAEGLQSSSELLFVERSYIARTFGDRREPGLMLDYNPKPIRVRLMASNGQVSSGTTGSNINDTNNSKDINARVDYSLSDELKMGVFGSQSHSIVGLSNRGGLNVHYTRERLYVGVDGMQGRELDAEKAGVAADVGYKFCDEMQAGFRYENFQQKTAPESANAYTLGLNYFLAGHNAKIQLAHTVLNNMLGTNGTISPSSSKNGTLTAFNFQMAL
ncbi:MAG: porin [Bdellovibrionales bacterium]